MTTIQYVIYEKPMDYPNKFVVRRFVLAHGDFGPQLVPVGVVDTLDEARKLVPSDFNYCFPRLPQDEPQIREVWMNAEVGEKVSGVMEKLHETSDEEDK